MKAYHGTNKVFDKFSLDFYREGETSDLYVKGINLTTNPKVAEDYRKKVADPHYFGTDFVKFDSEGVNRVDDENNDDVISQPGVVYEVTAPVEEDLLDWQSASQVGGRSIYEFVSFFIGEDAVEHFYDQIEEYLCEECDADGLRELEDNYEGAILKGSSSDEMNEIYSVAEGFDFSDFERKVLSKSPEIYDDTMTGKAIYDMIEGELGEEKAIAYLRGQGIKGIIDKNPNIPGVFDDHSVVIVFSPEDIESISMLSPSKVSALICQKEMSENNSEIGMGM